MALSDYQLDALVILEWLHNPRARREGRTLALAVAAIRQACLYPGEDIQIFDHTNTGPGRRQLQEIIRDMLQADYRLNPRVVLTERSLRLILPEPIYNWLPPEVYFQTAEARTAGRAAGQRLTRQFGREHENVREPEPLDGGGPLTTLQDIRDLMQRMRQLEAAAYDPTIPNPDPVPTETISQEAADRFANEAEAAAQRSVFGIKPQTVLTGKGVLTKKPVEKPPEPKSAWDRLLADED